MATTRTKTTKRTEATTTATATAPARGQGGARAGTRTLTHDGETLTIAEWADELGLTDAAIRMRLLKGLPVERVLGPRLEGKGGPPGKGADKPAVPPQRPQAASPKAPTATRTTRAPRAAEEREVAPTTVVVPAAPRHPAVELLEAVGYQVRQLPAPAGVVLLVQEAVG